MRYLEIDQNPRIIYIAHNFLSGTKFDIQSSQLPWPPTLELCLSTLSEVDRKQYNVHANCEFHSDEGPNPTADKQ
jgi:hypothetical protein